MVLRPAVGLALLLLAFVPVQAAPPPDAFCVILFEGADGYGVLRVVVDLETTLEEREVLFDEVDEDSDGIVTPAEQERFRQGTMRTWDNASSMGLRGLEMSAGDGVQQWGAGFLYAATWTQVGHTFHLQDHEQPATVTEPIDLETQEVREFHFEHPDEPSMVRVLGGRDPANETATTGPSTTAPPQSSTQVTTIEYVVVRAEPGWTIRAIQGHSYEDAVTAEPGVAEYDLPAFDTKRPFMLEFARDEPSSTTKGDEGVVTVRETITVAPPDKGAPGLPWALMAVGLLGALALRRRL